MKIFNAIYIILALAISANIACANNYTSINYSIYYEAAKKTPTIKVTTEIKGNLSKELILDLPSHWANAEYSNQIENIKIHNSDLVFTISKNDAHQMNISIPESTDLIKISYEIKQKAGNPSDVHEAIIRKDLVHSTGYGLFASPADISDKDEINFSIKWDVPSQWNSLSSYGEKNFLQFATTASKLLHAIYVSGDTRKYQISNKENPVFLSLYGDFDIKDSDFISSLSKIIKTQRNFFNDKNFPHYAISIIEGDNPNSMGGIGLHNSFAAFIPKEMDSKTYLIILAHEHLHNWIGGKIRNPAKQEELCYWWSEGFTEYFSRVLAVRSDMISEDEFIDECNQFFRNYFLSPTQNEPNSTILKDFWNDYNIEKLPYYRGFIFALYLNNKIKKSNSEYSLDNILLDIFKATENQAFSSELFKEIAKKYIPGGIEKEMQEYIHLGKTINLQDASNILPIEKIKMGVYELGFDRDSLKNKNIIKNINPKSNAYKSGLRNGDETLWWDFPKGEDPDQIATIKTSKGVFKFRPEHSNKKDVYQFKTNLSKENKLKIKEFFGI
jgi:predicted metalloprotease with PDZ domain